MAIISPKLRYIERAGEQGIRPIPQRRGCRAHINRQIGCSVGADTAQHLTARRVHLLPAGPSSILVKQCRHLPVDRRIMTERPRDGRVEPVTAPAAAQLCGRGVPRAAHTRPCSTTSRARPPVLLCISRTGGAIEARVPARAPFVAMVINGADQSSGRTIAAAGDTGAVSGARPRESAPTGPLSMAAGDRF